MSRQTQSVKEEGKEVKTDAQEDHGEPVARNEFSQEITVKDKRRLESGWEFCDPDLIEMGGGNPWNFYPL